MILRNAIFSGMTRYTDFQKSLDIAPNILAKRLDGFVDFGIMTTANSKSEHLEYHLTPKGKDFLPALLALREWGDHWVAPFGPPVEVLHEDCGGHVHVKLQCGACAATPQIENILARPTKAYTAYTK